MDGKVKGAIAVVVVVALGYVGFLVGSSFLFKMKVGERMKDLNRFATADQILALPKQIKEDAAHYKVNPDSISTDLTIEGRVVQGDVVFYFVVVAVHEGSKTWHDEARIESQQSLLEAGTRKRLEEAGVKFKGCG